MTFIAGKVRQSLCADARRSLPVVNTYVEPGVIVALLSASEAAGRVGRGGTFCSITSTAGLAGAKERTTADGVGL